MQIYIVRPGDTLRAIAGRFSLSAEVLAYINQLNDPSRLTIGMALLIPTTGKAPGHSMAVNAYAYPNISQTVLEEYIPSLSYLCPFTHMIDLQGQLSPLNDGMLLNVAAQSGVAPLLSVANLDPPFLNRKKRRRLLSSTACVCYRKRAAWGSILTLNMSIPSIGKAITNFSPFSPKGSMPGVITSALLLRPKQALSRRACSTRPTITPLMASMPTFA